MSALVVCSLTESPCIHSFGYWVGKPAVSDTTLNITVERVLECGCPWRWRTLEERGFRMLIRNYGNMQTFWRMISRVKHPFPGHPRVAVSLAPTHSHLSPAFSALPTSPPLPCHFPGTSMSFLDMFPLFCCPQAPGCFGEHPRRQWQPGGLTSPEDRVQGRRSSPRGGEHAG